MASPEVEEIKTLITSLLISNPMRTTIRQLERDYIEMEGRCVPFRKLGFSSFEQFLRSVPDIVNVYGSGLEAEVEGIALSKSEHINTMVLKQKKNVKSKGKRPARTLPKIRPSTVKCNDRSTIKPLLPPQYLEEKKKFRFKDSTSEISFHAFVREAAQYSKKVLELCQESNNQQNFPIVEQPQKLMVDKDFQALLRAAVQHPQRVLEFSKESQNQQTFPMVEQPQKPLVGNQFQFSKLGVYKEEEKKVPFKDTPVNKDFKALLRAPVQHPQRVLEFSKEFQNRQTFPTVEQPQKPLVGNQSQFSKLGVYKEEKKFPFKDTPVDKDFKALLRAPVQHLQRVLEFSKESQNRPIFPMVEQPLKPLVGNQSQVSKLNVYKESIPNNSMGGNEFLEKSSNEEEFKEKIKTSPVLPSPIKIDYISKVPTKVQINLNNLMQKFPEGIECTRLPAKYREMYKKNLLYEDYNYRSLIEMCSDLPNIFHYVRHSSDDYVLYDINVPLPSIERKEDCLPKQTQIEQDAKTSQELPITNWSSPFLLATDVMTMSDEIYRFFPADVVVDDILDITVGEIYDLSKFWVYMTFGGLNTLMEDLQRFFSENSDTYRLPTALLEEGLYCVSIYGHEYHRCVIVNMLNEQPDFMRVLFIDYGTVNDVSTSDVWFLPKKFGELPCQAIRARLSNIYPAFENRPWSASAVARFEKLVENRVLVGEVTRVDEKDHTVEIYLADITDKDNVFYINDIFVKEGFALYTNQERKKCLVDSNCVDNVKYIHLYPAFYEIESGIVPTIEDMRYIAASKIPLHHFIPQYFDIYYTEDIKLTQTEYERRMKKKITSNKILTSDLEEIDFSFFPNSILSNIKGLYEQTFNSKKEIKKLIKKELPENKIENKTSESVKEYFCNKKRISELIHGDTPKVERSETPDFCTPLESVEPFKDVVSNLQRLNTNDGDLCHPHTSSSTRTSTNPFFNNYVSNPSNPFQSTNPFLSDIEETVNNSELRGLFAKASEDTFPQRFVNNLKDTHKCACKVHKQVNIDKPVAQNNVVRTEATSTSDVASAVRPRVTPEIQDSYETSSIVPRVRTPPGFSSENLNNRMPLVANLGNYFYYLPNNPYYQRMPFTQFNANGFLPPDQLNPQLLNAYCNYMRQMNPNLFSYGVPQNFPTPKVDPPHPPQYP